MWAHFSRSWSRNAGRQPGASRLRRALTAAPSAELRRGAELALRHRRQAGAADLHDAVGAVRAVRFDARYRVARGPTSPPTSPQPHLDLRNPCKSLGSGTPPRRSRKPVWAVSSIEGSNPSLSAELGHSSARAGESGHSRAGAEGLSGGSARANVGPSGWLAVPPAVPPNMSLRTHARRLAFRNSGLRDGRRVTLRLTCLDPVEFQVDATRAGHATAATD